MSAESNNSTSNILFNHPKTRGVKMALLNIVSLPKHIDELRMSEFFNYFDLFALNQTRLDSTISDGLVKISGFNIVIGMIDHAKEEVFVSTSVILLIIKYEKI